MSERKRLLKFASRIPPGRVAEVLAADDNIPSGYFLVGDTPETYFVCCWHVTIGPMISMIDDNALHVACVQHLLVAGVPVFRSSQEVEAHAAAQGWPGPRTGA